MPFTRRDLTELAQLLRAAARTEILPRFRRLTAADIRAKSGPLDLVTAADEAAEALIAQGLSRLFSGCLVVGEEATAADPSLLDQLASAELAFTVDPIDGTSNYAAGLPLFGVMASVVSRGKTIAAVILDPIVDSFSAALAGQGAWEEASDGSIRPLHVAAPALPAAMTGTVAWRFMPPGLRDRALQALPQFAQSWNHRCAAHEYRTLAAGHSHVTVFYRLMPWDHLPGALLHEEAGGYAAKFDGTPYLPGDTSGGLICAPDLASWRRVRDLFVL
jgi:fructose-1,6-bisphosphatase/inositol monophosphatase family enzyme